MDRVSFAAFLAMALGFSMTSCKPRAGSGAQIQPSNVFTLPNGTYRFVRGSLTQGETSHEVMVKGGTGKVVVLQSAPGGVLMLRDQGKYAWSVGAAQPVNFDCTLKEKQDTWSFEVYSVEAGVGKLGNAKYTKGCGVDREPRSDSPARAAWKATSITPKAGGEFILTQEADIGGKKHTLIETYAVQSPP